MKWQLKMALLAVAPTLCAGPLVREHVSPQAKWLIHFDAEHFRTTKLGDFYVQNLLEKNLADAKAKHQFDFGPLVRSVKSATAYGTEYQQNTNDAGVLILQASPEAVDEIRSKLAGWLALEAAGGNKSGRIQQLTTDPFPLYHVDQQTMIAPLADGRLLLGKSRKHVEKAAEVVLGAAPNLTSTSRFNEWNGTDEAFILAVAADDLNKNAALAPHAKIFRHTDQGHFVVGERGDDLFLNLSLRAENTEAATRVKKLIEGLLAWAELERAEKQELQLISKSAQVGMAARTVTVGLAYPVERMIRKMAEHAKQTPVLKPRAE